MVFPPLTFMGTPRSLCVLSATDVGRHWLPGACTTLCISLVFTHPPCTRTCITRGTPKKRFSAAEIARAVDNMCRRVLILAWTSFCFPSSLLTNEHRSTPNSPSILQGSRYIDTHTHTHTYTSPLLLFARAVCCHPPPARRFLVGFLPSPSLTSLRDHGGRNVCVSLFTCFPNNRACLPQLHNKPRRLLLCLLDTFPRDREQDIKSYHPHAPPPCDPPHTAPSPPLQCSSANSWCGTCGRCKRNESGGKLSALSTADVQEERCSIQRLLPTAEPCSLDVRNVGALAPLSCATRSSRHHGSPFSPQRFHLAPRNRHR